MDRLKFWNTYYNYVFLHGQIDLNIAEIGSFTQGHKQDSFKHTLKKLAKTKLFVWMV